MITTVTMNASIDKLYLTASFSAGVVNRVERVVCTAGGKGMNVARVAALCGETVTAAGLIGGFNGQLFRSLITEEKIHPRFTVAKGETRSCINIRDEAGKTTELLEPGAPVDAETLERFYADYREAISVSSVVTISGSVPQGTPTDFYRRLISQAKSEGKQVLLDTSGATLLESIREKPTLIKPNTDEIRQLLKIDITSRTELVSAARELHKNGIPIVVVSLGKDGALAVCDDGIFYANTPDIPVANTVGCGDSMVAGFAVGLARGWNIEQTLRHATAVSTANALTMETGSFRSIDLEQILPQINITREG